MGTNALPALPFIIPYLTNPSPSLRLDAGTTAWQIAPEQFPSPLPALTNALLATTNDYPKFPRAVAQLRREAAFRLGNWALRHGQPFPPCGPRAKLRIGNCAR
jgi:hypothetical protein